MRTFTLLLCLSIPCLAMAQGGKATAKTTRARQTLITAQAYINQNRFEEAAAKLRQVVKIKPDFAVAHRELGRVYLEMGQYEKSIESLERSFQLDGKLSRAAYFECAEAHFINESPEKAAYYYQKYQEMKYSRYLNKSKEAGMELGYDRLLATRQKNLAYQAAMDRSPAASPPANMGSIINSAYDDYLPTITSDGNQLVFTRQGKHGDEDVVTCEYKNDGWKKSRAFGKAINTRQNEGMAKFETHGRAFYFSGCMRSDTKGGCDIYQAILEQDDVKEVKKLEGLLNSEYWDSQPSITCDGNKMFFTSNRNGGFGGADIWYSQLQSNGQWGLPINAGPAINTEGDEEAPFISSDGLTLYFTSSGRPGQGEGDLFISRYANGTWPKATNMGLPFNSPAKELGFYVQGDGKTAYFSSARKGGQGGLDIYQIELAESLRPNPMVHLEGLVRNANTELPLSATVEITGEGIRQELQTDEQGFFFTCFPGNKSYFIQVEHPDYELFMDTKFFKPQDNASPVCYTAALHPKEAPKATFVSKGVTISERRVQFFFDFDSHQLTASTRKDLKKLTGILHKEPDWRVEVVGYTDSKGDHAYNMALSQRRAAAIVDFLSEEGIDIEQVIRNEGRGKIQKGEGKTDARKARRVDVILRK